MEKEKSQTIRINKYELIFFYNIILKLELSVLFILLLSNDLYMIIYTLVTELGITLKSQLIK